MESNTFEQEPKGENLRLLVKLQIAQNSLLKDENITALVKGDKVILNGNVDSLDKKWLAEDIAGDVLGVFHVKNEIRVADSDSQPDIAYQEDFYENL
jgi:osmotically-inducible protein OsmY